MGLYFTTNDYGTNASVGNTFSTDYWTISVWVHVDVDIFSSGDLLTVWGYDKAGSSSYIRCQIYSGDADPTNPYIYVIAYDGTTTVELWHNISILGDAWQHIAVRGSSTAGELDYLALYHDGTLVDDDSTTLGDFDTSLSRIHVGCMRSGLTRSNYFEGTISDLAVYTYDNSIVSFTWITSKLAGVWSPHNVRPSASYWYYTYWPLRSAARWGSNDQSQNQKTLTLTGPTWDEDDDPKLQDPRIVCV